MNESLLNNGQEITVTYDENYELKPPFKGLPPGNYEATIREASMAAKKNDPNGRNLVLDMVVSAPRGNTGARLRDFLPIPIGRYESKEDADRASFRLKQMIASMHSEKEETMQKIKSQSGMKFTPQYLISKKVWINVANEKGSNGKTYPRITGYIKLSDFQAAPGPDESVEEPKSETASPQVSTNPTEALKGLLPPDTL